MKLHNTVQRFNNQITDAPYGHVIKTVARWRRLRKQIRKSFKSCDFFHSKQITFRQL